MLEPDDGKLSCPVLRGERRSNPSDLPDVQIVIYPGKKEAVGITFQNDYMGIYQDINATGKVNKKLKNEINIFLDDWLSNIINCEYKLAETED